MKTYPYYLLLLVLFTFSACNNEDLNEDTDAPIIDTNTGTNTEDLDLEGLPEILFDVQLPNIANTKAYTIDVNQWDIPTNGTNAIKTTTNLQAAIDWAHNEGYTRITLPQGHYLVGEDVNDAYQGGIEIHDNTEFVFSAGAVLEIATNNKWNYCVLKLTGDHITIRDGIIKGDRDTHSYTPRSDGGTAHDEGHGICVWDNNKVLIDNIQIHDVTGDGALVLDSNDVTFTNNTIYNNRRQGISIVGGVRIKIAENEIHHINGTSPQFGIDIEGPGRVDEDILIHNNYFHHNRGGDIVNTTGENVYILDNTMEQGSENTYIDGPIVSWHKTHNIIAKNTVTMTSGSVNGGLGYIQYSRGGDKGHNKITYVHENVFNNCGMYMYNSSDADVRRNKFLGYFVAFSDFKNVTLVDNLLTYSEANPEKTYCRSYRFKNATGYASGNYIGDTLEELPLSESTPYTMKCVLDGW
ncbi:MAG TPA: right-handed parallel beta-helix repeat-containing protein [Mariniflexile sp.]